MPEEVRVDAFLGERTDAAKLVRICARDAIAVLDCAGRIMRINAQAERMFAYPREEPVGQPVEMLMPER